MEKNVNNAHTVTEKDGRYLLVTLQPFAFPKNVTATQSTSVYFLSEDILFKLLQLNCVCHL